MKSKKRNVSTSTKKLIAGRQHYKCANTPSSDLKGLNDYKCPLWQINSDNKGSFDASGYEIDHINEHTISLDDSPDNLQALCKSCHSVKTKKFLNKNISGGFHDIKDKKTHLMINVNLITKNDKNQSKYLMTCEHTDCCGNHTKYIDDISSYITCKLSNGLIECEQPYPCPTCGILSNITFSTNANNHDACNFDISSK